MSEKKTDQFYTRPPKLGKWEGFRLFLWNSETSQFLGRTGGSWAKILLFYVIFYAALIGFFSAMLAVFYQTLDDTKPKWQLESSLIGSNPGLGFRPMPSESNIDSTLIWYKASDKGNVRYWQDELDKFLAVYNTTKNPDTVQNCDNLDKPDMGKVCDFQVSDRWGYCSKKFGYGYDNEESGPCIFLKLNKIYGWVPSYYNTSIETMSPTLKQIIADHHGPHANLNNNNNLVWVECEGENPADTENIGSIQYYPQQGFHQKYFPFTNIPGYLSPLVAVHFEKPRRGVLINIECKAWAKNIIHDRVDRRGSVHFELMVD